MFLHLALEWKMAVLWESMHMHGTLHVYPRGRDSSGSTTPTHVTGVEYGGVSV